MNEKQIEALRVIGGDSLVNHIIERQERLIDIWKSHMESEVETTNTSTQLTKLTCENCGAALTIHSQRLLTCDHCGTTYLVNNVGELIEALGEYDIAPREIQFDDYFYTGPSY